MPMQVPLSLHESTVEHFRARDPEGQPVPDAALDHASFAMAEARKAAEQLAAVAEAVAHDVTMLPATRALKLKEAADKVGEASTAKLDSAREKLLKALEELDRTMMPAPAADAAELQLRGEVRARLAGMTEKKRGEAIAEALKFCDPVVCGAIFGAGVSPMLLGISAAEFEARRYAYRQIAFPEALERQARIKKALDAVERGAGAFLGMIETALNSPEAALAAASEAKTKAALEALKGEAA